MKVENTEPPPTACPCCADVSRSSLTQTTRSPAIGFSAGAAASPLLTNRLGFCCPEAKLPENEMKSVSLNAPRLFDEARQASQQGPEAKAGADEQRPGQLHVEPELVAGWRKHHVFVAQNFRHFATAWCPTTFVTTRVAGGKRTCVKSKMHNCLELQIQL